MAGEAEFSVKAVAEARIAVYGHETDAESLWHWLRDEPELCGRLRVGSAPTSAQTMGVPIELVVVLATAATAVVSALARSVSTWLVQSRADVIVKVTGPDGRQVSVSARRIADPETLLRAVLDGTDHPPVTGREPDTTGER